MRHASHGRFAWWTRLSGLALLCLLPGLAWPADLHVPATVEAGKAFSVPAEGSGDATFYLLGPDHVVKRTVSLGQRCADSIRRCAGRRPLSSDSLRIILYISNVRGKGRAAGAFEFLPSSFTRARLYS